MSYQRKVCGIFVFCYFFLFCSLVGNENIKRLGFYTLQVTTVFSNFPALKQLSKIKNTRECCDPLEFVISLSWRSEVYIYIRYKRPCRGYVPFRLFRLIFRVLQVLQ